mgnify:CR=1 FL=1
MTRNGPIASIAYGPTDLRAGRSRAERPTKAPRLCGLRRNSLKIPRFPKQEFKTPPLSLSSSQRRLNLNVWRKLLSEEPSGVNRSAQPLSRL